MEPTRDVDDSILDLGRSLLPYVRMNGHPDLTLNSLAELPWMFILMFELITSQTLDDDEKPFGTIGEQANTLQTMLNTLQQNLRLPLNHITGTGLATLERRQLADALTIFADLLRYCYPMAEPEFRQAQVAGAPEENRLTRSVLDTSLTGCKIVFENGTKFPRKEIPNNQDITQANVPSHNSPVATVLPVAQDPDNLSNISCNQRTQVKQTGHTISNGDRKHGQKEQPQMLYPFSRVPILTDSSNGDRKHGQKEQPQMLYPFSRVPILTDSSTQSSTTLAKELYAQIEQEPGKSKTTSSLTMEQKYLRKTPSVQVFESTVPSLSMLSPKKSVRKRTQPRKFPCKEKTTSESKTSRYAPYYSPGKQADIRDPLQIAEKLTLPAKSAKTISNSNPKGKQAPIRVRTTSSCTSVRRPSVKSFQDPGPLKARRVSVASSNSLFGKERPMINRPCRDQEFVKNVSKGEKMKRVSTTSASNCKPRMMSTSSRKHSVSSSSVSSTNNKEPVCSQKQVFAQAPSSSDVDVEQQYPASITSRDVYKDQIECFTKKDLERGENQPASKCQSPVGGDPHDTKRRPSVVSTKYRKHSSPISLNMRQQHKRIQTDQTIARGESPQTISLCSSLKLLKEFEYIRKRLKQISAKKIEHMQALQDLEQEEERLMCVLSHVHQHTGTPSRSNRATTERRNARAELV